MARHHYVPQFLLRQWAPVGQLRTYRWLDAARQVVAGSASVAAACQIKDLHAFFGMPRDTREAPEREFYTPLIDTPAADAHRVMLSAGVNALSFEQRRAWARLLVSLGGRTPECLRTLGPEQWRRAMAQLQLGEIAETDNRALERNVPLQIAMELAVDETRVGPVTRMCWWLRRFAPASVLIGDRPLISQPSANWPCGIAIDDPNCLIVLPLAPDTIFFASANVRHRTTIRREASGKLVRSINVRTIAGAVDYVYAIDCSMRDFVVAQMHGKPQQIWPLSRLKIV